MFNSIPLETLFTHQKIKTYFFVFVIFFLGELPFSVRVLLESVVRNCDGFQVHEKDVETLLNWKDTQHNDVEFPFRPARTLLQDFT